MRPSASFRDRDAARKPKQLPTPALGCLLTATLFVLIKKIVVTVDDGFSQKLVNCVVVSTAGVFAQFSEFSGKFSVFCGKIETW